MTSYAQSFDFAYKVLTSLGLWSVENSNTILRRIYMIYQSCVLLLLLTISYGLIWNLYLVSKDVHKVSTNLSCTLTILMLIWKNSQGLRNISRIRRLQKELNHDTNAEMDPDDRQILMRAAKEIRLTSVFVYIMGLGLITIWLITGYLTGKDRREMPLPMWIPWEYETSPEYEWGLSLQGYAAYLVTIDLLSLNLTIFGTILQICAEYDILVHHTRKIKEWCEDKKSLGEEENAEVGRRIAENIRRHQRIIHFVDEAETSYSGMMVVQFGGSALLITVVSLDLILVSRQLDSRAMTLVVFFGLVTSDIYLFCFYGSRLMHKSYEFLDCVYDIPWPIMNLRNRKTVMVIMMKAQRAPNLTIAKFANIDLYSLLKLTRIVYNVLYLLLHLATEK